MSCVSDCSTMHSGWPTTHSQAFFIGGDMQKFFDMWEIATRELPGLKLTIQHSSIADWTIEISGRESENGYYHDQSCLHDILLAKAYIWLSDYLVEKCGGY